ncbi:MAG: AAA family ATPase [Bacteroidetes bacterium]|nr:AAA family ATPase [Bacteroidota bacterium]
MVFLASTKLSSSDLPDRYPFNIPSLKNLSIDFKYDVTFLVGENGSGKSTLLEAIATNIGFNASGGNKNHSYDYHKTESPLSKYIRLSWHRKLSSGFFLRAESFFNFATYIDNLAKENRGILIGYGGKSLHQQSHGESFLSLFKNRFTEGIYLLDEPEAALSPQRQLSFLSIIHELQKSNKSQFIIATHSPILLAYPNAQIFLLGNEGIRQVRYTETEHYTLTKEFLDSPDRFFRHLFDDKE